MMKKYFFLITALLMSVGFAVAGNVVSIGLPSPDSGQGGNGDNQPGWSTSGSAMDQVAAAKYMVIETEGVGDNAGGFGGIHFIYQGNNGDGGSISIGWTDVGLNGGWLGYPRAAGKTVSIAFDIKAAMGANYENYLQCTAWSRMILAYYPSGLTAVQGLAIKDVYLTADFAKPTGAVDLTGTTGFVFDGSVKDILGGETATNPVLDFESDAVGKAYPVIAWSPADISAVVENNPAGNGKSLHIINNNWNSYPLFSVTLPSGKTLSDVDSIAFDLYFQSIEAVGGQTPNSYKSFNYFIGSTGTAFSPGTTTGSAVNIVADAGKNPGQTWLHKEFALVVPDSILKLSLNKFDFGFGMGINNAGNYFLDNITFVLKGGTGIIPIKPVVTQAYGVTGGVVVNAVNEKVSIYGIDGNIVKQVVIHGSQTISLEKGLYIVKVGAAKAVKVIVR